MTTSEGALCRDLDGAPAKVEVASETMMYEACFFFNFSCILCF